MSVVAGSPIAPRLPRRVTVGYGVADLGLEAVEVLLQLYLLKFYNVVVGVPSAWAGAALAIGMVWDAISDPMMGAISDRTRGRFGRRRPYLLPGAVLLAASLIAVFHPPSGLSPLAGAGYLLAAILALNTALTIVSVPYVALGADLSFDRDERTELFGSRRAFGTLGLVVGTVLPAVLYARAGGGASAEAVSRGEASWWIAGPLIAAVWVTVRLTRGRDLGPTGAGAAVRTAVRRAFADSLGVLRRNRVFRPLVLAFLVASAARTLNASMALYYYEYRLRIPEPTTVGHVLMPFFLFFLVSIPLWIRVSRRWGKRTPAMGGVVGLGLLTTVIYLVAPPDSLALPRVIAVAGGLLSGAIILFDSLVADIVDVDELGTGQRREGLYFGVWRLSMKVSRAVGLALSGVLLGAIGFDPAVPVSDSVSFGLAVLFGPVVGGLFVVAGLAVLLCPLTDERHRRVQALLVRRRRIRARLRSS